MVIPKNVKSDKLLKDRTVKMPNPHVKTPRILVAYIRETENFSTKKVIAGSMREIEDVMAAKNNKTKKVAMIPPKSMAQKQLVMFEILILDQLCLDQVICKNNRKYYYTS